MQALLSGNPWQLSFWLPPARLSPKGKNIKVSQEICLNFSFLFGSFTSWQQFKLSWPAFQNSGKENTKKETKKTPKTLSCLLTISGSHFSFTFHLIWSIISFTSQNSLFGTLSWLKSPENFGLLSFLMWQILYTRGPAVNG